MAASDAQKRATAKYLKENMEELRFRVKKDQARIIRARAEEKGMSFRAYMLDLIDQDLKTE